MNKGKFAFLWILFAAIFVLTACSSGATPTPLATTSLDGSTLLQERCSVCHPLYRVEGSRHTSADWKLIVDAMVARGAQLSPSEEKVVVSYLSTNFGQ